MRDHPSAVLPGLGPGIHDFAGAILKSWMAGPSPARTRRGKCQLDCRKIHTLLAGRAAAVSQAAQDEERGGQDDDSD